MILFLDSELLIMLYFSKVVLIDPIYYMKLEIKRDLKIVMMILFRCLISDSEAKQGSFIAFPETIAVCTVVKLWMSFWWRWKIEMSTLFLHHTHSCCHGLMDLFDLMFVNETIMFGFWQSLFPIQMVMLPQSSTHTVLLLERHPAIIQLSLIFSLRIWNTHEWNQCILWHHMSIQTHLDGCVSIHCR